ncbi:MAG: RNA-binding protein [Pseudomonadota bacterium]
MKPFVMNPKMLTMGGAFYPKGYALIMFANEDDLNQVANELEKQAPPFEETMHLTPQDILSKLAGAHGESDVPMPSVGTEGRTVQRFAELARQGHHGLMIHAPSDEDMERAMEFVRRVPYAYGQKYHLLAIEDL